MSLFNQEANILFDNSKYEKDEIKELQSNRMRFKEDYNADNHLIINPSLSRNVQELLNDYKFYSLHQHLFDGYKELDIWLTKIDLIFDQVCYDLEFFGVEPPSHFWNSTIFSGLFSLPLYIIFAYLSSMEGNELFSDKHTIYEYVFAGKVQNLIVCCLVPILYLIKPLATTNFILSINSKMTYLTFEIFARLFIPSITMLLIVKDVRAD